MRLNGTGVAGVAPPSTWRSPRRLPATDRPWVAGGEAATLECTKVELITVDYMKHHSHGSAVRWTARIVAGVTFSHRRNYQRPNLDIQGIAVVVVTGMRCCHSACGVCKETEKDKKE